MFKQSFKCYKSKNPPPSLSDVLDFNKPNYAKVRRASTCCHYNSKDLFDSFGLIPSEKWEVYEFIDIPDLIFIRNPFTTRGQQYWIVKCLREYTKKPNKLNLDAHCLLDDQECWWDICNDESERGKDLLPKLRWATMGYHHDWDVKHYTENSKTEMPGEVVNLTGLIAKSLGFSDFKAEAAIVNYYRMNSTLAGHTDHSEADIEAPLFSISFGQEAIFLIGGNSIEDKAEAMTLRSGDVLVMSKSARLRYHGVPRIMPSSERKVWTDDSLKSDFEDWHKFDKYLEEARINLNVRQVLRVGQETL